MARMETSRVALLRSYFRELQEWQDEDAIEADEQQRAAEDAFERGDFGECDLFDDPPCCPRCGAEIDMQDEDTHCTTCYEHIGDGMDLENFDLGGESGGA